MFFWKDDEGGGGREAPALSAGRTSACPCSRLVSQEHFLMLRGLL